jgi:hypothetical protein
LHSSQASSIKLDMKLQTDPPQCRTQLRAVATVSQTPGRTHLHPDTRVYNFNANLFSVNKKKKPVRNIRYRAAFIVAFVCESTLTEARAIAFSVASSMPSTDMMSSPLIPSRIGEDRVRLQPRSTLVLKLATLDLAMTHVHRA